MGVGTGWETPDLGCSGNWWGNHTELLGWIWWDGAGIGAVGCPNPNICVTCKVQLSLNHEQPGLVGGVPIHGREMELDHLQAPFLSKLCWNSVDVLPFLIYFTHSIK